jgi:nitrogen fixation/metabolism regulation signal transduction histidine kinase
VTSKPKGTGLGLAIVKKLVEEHGGQIRAGNAKRGGAEISILIPVTHAEEDSKLNQRADKGRESA